MRKFLIFLLLSPLLFSAGCNTWRSGTADGAFALSSNAERFRGRWWSYYARGRAAQERGDFAAAERDFQTALKSRPDDQLWPRTYGMHFLPEYFPRRELGVNHFLQGRMEESISALEASLSQQYSARAAFYYREAQAEAIRSDGRDQEAPRVEAASQQGPLSETSFQFSGVARDDTLVAAVSVNGTPFDVRVVASEVPFAVPVSLLPGDNTVEVVVRDIAGRETAEEVILQNDVDGPTVSFDSASATQELLTGLVLDPSGVASLAVAGVEAALVDQGGGVYAFSAELSGRSVDGPLNFISTDRLGNRTAGVVPGTAGGRAIQVAWNLQTLPHGVLGAETAVQPAGPLRVSFENIDEGKRYYQDEVVLNLKVDTADAPIENLALNSDPETILGGDPIRLIPDRPSQFVTRRISFNDRKGDITLVAKVVDQGGAVAEDSRTITREENALEVVENRLAVTFIPDRGEDGAATAEDAAMLAAVMDELQNSQTLFERFEIVEREQLGEVLRELEISALLAETERQLAQGEFIPFEVLFAVHAKRVQGNLEIIVEGTGAETGAHVIFPRIEVSGPETEADALVENLAVRLLQEFPRAPGTVQAWSAPSLKCSLTEDQGAFRNRKCLLFKLEGDGPPEEQFPFIMGEGLIDGISARYTSVKLLKTADGSVVSALPVEKGQYVVLK